MASSASVYDETDIIGTGAPRFVPEPAINDVAPREFTNPFSSSKAALRLRMYLALVLIDVAALCVAFVGANMVRFGDPLHGAGLDAFVILLPIYGVIAFHSGAYSLDVLMKPKLGVKRSSRSLVFAVAIVIGTLFYLKTSTEFSRVVMAIGTAGSLVTFTGARWILGHSAGKRHKWRFMNEVLFVDNVPILPRGGEIVIFANQAGLHPSADDPVLLDRMGRLLERCDRVVLACPTERRAAWAKMMKGIDAEVEILMPELDELGALAMRRMGDQSTLLVSNGPLALRDTIIKRTFDLALTLPLLIVLTPIFAIIALAIKLDAPGPVLFQQRRTGRGNRNFNILKFRSMRTELADKNGARSAARDDDRVTRVGRFLRRTSLDELPQLINVLKGEMSIVGPRPHALGSTAEDALFWNIDARYWERHVVQPGITGLAQIRGFRGATLQRRDVNDRVQADLEYVTDWSIWRDIGILCATAKVMLHRNAF